MLHCINPLATDDNFTAFPPIILGGGGDINDIQKDKKKKNTHTKMMMMGNIPLCYIVLIL